MGSPFLHASERALILISDRGPSLRDRLRDATAPLHETLDKTVSPLALGDRDDYARFLSFQYAARQPIEAWIDGLDIECAPPAMCGLIAEDLEELGNECPPALTDFEVPSDSDELGLLWVLAGSSLGNRMILSKRGHTIGTRFLADTAMVDYWKGLRPRLEASANPAEADRAVSAAKHAFHHFIGLAPSFGQREAA